MKKIGLVVPLFILMMMLSGCGDSGGSSGISGVTIPAVQPQIYGKVALPQVAATGVVGDITYSSSTSLLSKFASEGTFTVNGKSVSSDLATGTGIYHLTNLDTASSYDVRLTHKNLTLRMTIPHSSLTMFKNIDLNTTVQAWLFEQYAFTPTQMANYEINSTLQDGLAQKFLTLLQDPAGTNDSVKNGMATELANFVVKYPTVNSFATDLTPAVTLTGTWLTPLTAVWYENNLNGERATKVTGQIKMVLKQSGNVVTGTLTTLPKKWESLPGIDLYYPAVGTVFAIQNGKISSTNFSFSHSSSSGLIDEWKFTMTSDIMAGGVTNKDLNTYFGMDSDVKAFSLTRQ